MPPGPAIPENCLTLPEAFIKTIDHFVPAFLPALANVPDHRDTARTICPIEEELLAGMPTFTMKLGARRNIKYKLNNPAFVGNLQQVGKDREETSAEKKRFVWLSSLRIDRSNVRELSRDGGRARWIIENQGFNTQKNGGYGLEHAFSTDNKAMKNFYLLMQIGHIFNQLMEKGSLLRERIKTEMGSLKVFPERLWASFTEVWLDTGRLRAILKQQIRIRFNTS